jgi:hypothetical protein
MSKYNKNKKVREEEKRKTQKKAGNIVNDIYIIKKKN